MPFTSKKQRGKFYAMASRGEISKAKVAQWDAETPDDKAMPKYSPSAAAMRRRSQRRRHARG